MAIYTTLFVSEPEKLQSGFPGWKLPLAKPVTRQRRHPFTGEELIITTREPEWDDFDPETFEIPTYHAVVTTGDYASYIEQRIPQFVRSRPHWCTKNLTSVELIPLISAATDAPKLALEMPLYAHPSFGKSIEKLPDALAMHLTVADEATLRLVAQKWASRMSTPEFTYSVTDWTRLYDDWSFDDAMNWLGPIVSLSKQRADGHSMYLLTEA